MSGTLTPTNEIGEVLTVDISDTVGQESAIGANGGPVFTVKVTDSPMTWVEPSGRQYMVGMGRVVSDGPVNGYEVAFYPAGREA